MGRPMAYKESIMKQTLNWGCQKFLSQSILNQFIDKSHVEIGGQVVLDFQNSDVLNQI